MEFFQKIDEYLFYIINSLGWKEMDEVMILISSKWFWIPLYIYIIFLIYKNFKSDFYKILIALAVLIFLQILDLFICLKKFLKEKDPVIY